MTTADVASDEEMRSVVGRWAEAKGLSSPASRPWWTGQSASATLHIGRWIEHAEHKAGGILTWDVSPHAALVWALVMEARPLRDGSRCMKLCAGSGRVPKYIGLAGTRPVEYIVDGSMPCPNCEGTGLADLTDAYAQHVLDAQPRERFGLRFITKAGTDGVALRCRVNGADLHSVETLHVLADQLQSRSCTACERPAISMACQTCGKATANNPLAYLGFALAHLLVGSREGTTSAVEALRRATPAPRRGGRLVALLFRSAHELRVEHVQRRTFDVIRFATLESAHVYVCSFGFDASVRQQVQLLAGPSTSLHDIARQVELQTVGLVTTVDVAQQCVEVTERVDEPTGEYGITVDGQMATFSGVDLTPAEVVAQINRQLDNVVASVDERGSIMIDVSAYRSTISSDASIDVTAWTHDADDPIADETTLPALRNPDRLRPSERQRRRQQQTRDVTALRERRRGYARSSWSRP